MLLSLLIAIVTVMVAPAPNNDWQGVAPAQTDASTVGQWSPVQNWPVQATHAHLLPTGQVLYYPAWAQGETPYLWDPVSGSSVVVALPGYNIFCSGHTFLADGRVFVAGGHVTNDVGLPHASIYSPFSNTWTQLPDMNAGRWYPTSTILSSGDVLVISGEETLVNGSVVWDALPQVWQNGSNSWRDLSSAQLVISQWYPFMYAAPNGHVFEAGPDQVTRYLNTWRRQLDYGRDQPVWQSSAGQFGDVWRWQGTDSWRVRPTNGDRRGHRSHKPPGRLARGRADG
jgi:galactose oxidase